MLDSILEKPSATSSPGDVDKKIDGFDVVASQVPDVIGGLEGVTPIGGDDPSEAELFGPAGQPLLNEKAVRFYLKTGFELAAAKTGDDRWKLDNQELDMATPATLPVAEKWLAWLLAGSAYKEEVAFCLVMAGIVGPRLLMPKLATTTAGPVTPAS